MLASDFKVGDEVILNEKASRKYNYTQQGARGIVTKVEGTKLRISFDTSTLSGYAPTRRNSQQTRSFLVSPAVCVLVNNTQQPQVSAIERKIKALNHNWAVQQAPKGNKYAMSLL